MALQSDHVEPNFHKLEENEIEVSLDADEAAEGGSFGEGSLNRSDKLKYEGIPDKDDRIYVGDVKYIGNDVKDEGHGSHQGDSQLEEQKNLASPTVPQFRRTRPRIQLGLTPRQLRELEDFFETTKYPDAITRYVDCFRNNPNFHSLESDFSLTWSLICLEPQGMGTYVLLNIRRSFGEVKGNILIQC